MMNILKQLPSFLAAVQGAMRDHRQWIHSPRARTLEESVEMLAQVLVYLGLLLWVWVLYTLWFDVDQALTGRIIEIPADALEARTALFYILAGAFAVPAALLAAVFLVVWVYRLGQGLANRHLTRFAQCLYYPVVLLVTASLTIDYQPALSSVTARAWLAGESVWASATRQRTASPPVPAATPESAAMAAEELKKLRYQMMEILSE